ncbi:MAG: hypothetical protein NTX53_06395, partial [candidate division WOR-3 bacterium]|nr:hypothetical protein [candidate division WOR-3 bacterium]
PANSDPDHARPWRVWNQERPRDIEDVRIILARNPGFDRAYTELWLRRFSETLSRDISSILRRLLAT